MQSFNWGQSNNTSVFIFSSICKGYIFIVHLYCPAYICFINKEEFKGFPCVCRCWKYLRCHFVYILYLAISKGRGQRITCLIIALMLLKRKCTLQNAISVTSSAYFPFKNSSSYVDLIQSWHYQSMLKWKKY